jgi:hypothetical protein
MGIKMKYKRPYIKRDARELLKKFTTKRSSFKNGDLVLVASIYRITDVDWNLDGEKRDPKIDGPRTDVEVVDVWPVCKMCSDLRQECCHHHILDIGRAGQYCAMKLK